MTQDQAGLQADLRDLIGRGATLDQLTDALRRFAAAGGSREAAIAVLERLRAEAADEAFEDRVLEVMDIATGFAPPHRSVWPDPPA